MTNTDIDLKRWTIWDNITEKIYNLTDKEFNDGVSNGFIKLSGKFMADENKTWIDGIVTK